ncbi:hypothetical protein J437_LFUL011413 [Ladona fulva]|uniref:Rab3 GTPase-activating protein catalytic subunit n=1 Tax=Ladona fulva TaxID=123851 RepID=A0A8K0KD28_LADFU|nr:hypothetical protein J437_LFUL011413 [Ladona fulva]
MLNQKFQMLNCCIERRRKEKESRELQSSNNSSFNYDSENSEDEDDNFFDCPDVPPAGDVDNENKSGISQVRGPKLSLWNRPEGRLKKMKDVYILSTGEQLYVPITQEVPPKTEDQIEEDAELMEMLGNDALGTELRASMMCASLLSDMESFKAANPSAELIDFIRWYSPRDWVEEESLNEFGQKKGHLSERMLLPGNKWQEVWKAAKPVPARRQKRLFNEGCVAEKVLHFLEVLSISKIFCYLMPLLFQAALWKIGQEMQNLESSEEKAENIDESDSEENLDDSTKNDKNVIDTMLMKNFSDNTSEPLLSEEISFPETLPQALKKIASRIRNMSLNPTAADQAFYSELIFELAKVESLVSMARGAQIQFRIDKQKLKVKDYLLFLKSLICEEEAVILGGHKSPVGERVWNFIQQERWMDGKLLDEHLNAEQKEYVFQVMATRPAPYSRPTPQRLTAIVKEGEFRLAGAFSQDTNFF